MSQDDQDIEITRPVDKIPTLSQTKAQPKLIRVLTVLAYILSVSMAAILLSIYYIFIWKGNNTQAMPLQGDECKSYWQEQQSMATNAEENVTVEMEDGSGSLEDFLRNVDNVTDTTEGYRESTTNFGDHEHNISG